MGLDSVGLDSVGLLLAGGKSSRMGRNKALLSWQGKPLYRHMIDILEASGIDRVLLSRVELNDDPYNEQHNEQVVADIISDRGPLGGIHAALAELPDHINLIVVPVDMPLLPVACCQQLLNDQRLNHQRLDHQRFSNQRFSNQRFSNQVSEPKQPVPICYEGCYESYTLPMVLPVNPALRAQVEKAINSSNHRDYSLRNLHRMLGGEYLDLPPADEILFKNTNTPEDWQSALSMGDTEQQTALS